MAESEDQVEITRIGGSVQALGSNERSEPQENEGRDKSSSKLTELTYCFSSYQAILPPVSITMILSALTVVVINDAATIQAGQAVYAQTYEAFNANQGGNGQKLAASLGNTFIIVLVVCAMTFVVVLLYKYNCMKILMGYMIIATFVLLAYFTGSMWYTAINIYNMGIDKISFCWILYNYAVVGTAAIFYGRGMPKYVTQGYLITSSVALAWKLSYFSAWTAWTLLVMLALYDLFAVLTPCGPLRWLVSLMSRSDAPELPSLLYEASLPENVRRPNRRSEEEAGREPPRQGGGGGGEVPNQQPTQNPGANESVPNDEDLGSSVQLSPTPIVSVQEEVAASVLDVRSENPAPVSDEGQVEADSTFPPETERSENVESITDSPPPPDRSEDREIDTESMETGKVPLALAKIYKLRVLDDNGVLQSRHNQDRQRIFTPEEIRSTTWTARQLRTEVTVFFPRRGGRIERSSTTERGQDPRYIVYARNGEVLRTFTVNRSGEVFQVVKKENAKDPKDNSIKLGLVSPVKPDETTEHICYFERANFTCREILSSILFWFPRLRNMDSLPLQRVCWLFSQVSWLLLSS